MQEKKSSGLSPAAAVLAVVILLFSAVLVMVILRLVVQLNDSVTFPEAVSVNGIDVGGLTAGEAEEKLLEQTQAYTLRVRFADGEQTLTAEDISLQPADDKRLRSLARELNAPAASLSQQGRELWDEELLSWDEEALRQTVRSWPNLTSLAEKKSKDAKLVYSEEMGRFRVKPEVPGGSVDEAELEERIRGCLHALTGELDLLKEGMYGELRTADSPVVEAALTEANEKLKLELTYHYEVEQADIDGRETIGFDQLSRWLFVESDGLSVGVDSNALQRYVSEMKELYSAPRHEDWSESSLFVTSTGQKVEVSHPALGETVDTDALYNDIISCVEKGVSGERDAPYDQDLMGTTDLGGSYVEVDLDGQHLWLYKNNELVAEQDICSGDVDSGCQTPTGLYTIKDKQTDRWLNGEDYHDWVSYWMPFNGGVGLHDATWRSEDEFGGDVYLENGSHGCINMPLDLAGTVYDNVEVGTYVILYGGVTSLAEKAQVLTGKSSYSKKEGDGAFQLKVKTTGDGALSYASSNVKVVRVNDQGKVTIVGPGKATIRVTAEGTEEYRRASKDVSIHVKQNDLTEEKS